MKPMLKILRINTYIQQFQIKIYLDGKEIETVCLDGSWSTRDGEYDPERFLTNEQLEDLFQQTIPAGATKPPAQE